MPRHFAYGSNMDLAYLQVWLTQRGARADAIKSATAATLEGYELVFNFQSATWGGLTANLVPKEDGKVEGILMEMDNATLSRLDQKESVPKAYERRKVTVKVASEAGEKVHDDAIAYVAPKDRCVAPGKPPAKYLDHLLKGAEAFGLSEAYRAMLKASG